MGISVHPLNKLSNMTTISSTCGLEEKRGDFGWRLLSCFQRICKSSMREVRGHEVSELSTFIQAVLSNAAAGVAELRSTIAEICCVAFFAAVCCFFGVAACDYPSVGVQCGLLLSRTPDAKRISSFSPQPPASLLFLPIASTATVDGLTPDLSEGCQKASKNLPKTRKPRTCQTRN